MLTEIQGGGGDMEQVALVAVAAATYAIDKPYDYLVPASLAERGQGGDQGHSALRTEATAAPARA